MYEWGLIDLKRLHDDVEYWEQHDDPKQPDYDTRDIEDVINHQPIVEAIPIEWIVQYQNKHQLYGACDDDYIIIDNMLCAWEAENEI